MIALPTVPATVSMACRMGTPLWSRVDRVDAKRAMATLWVSLPNTGTFSLKRSRYLRPIRVRPISLTAMTRPAMMPITARTLLAANSEMFRSMRVMAGIWSAPTPNSSYISMNFGRMKVTRKATMPTAATITMTG